MGVDPMADSTVADFMEGPAIMEDIMLGTIEDTMAGVITGVITGAITHIGDYGDGDFGDGLFWDGPMLVGPTMAMEDTHI